MAGVIETMVFTMVDPSDLQWYGAQLNMSRQTTYTLGFFAFWLVTCLSSAMTIFLAGSTINGKNDKTE
jgi:hypothetical protein